MNTNKLLNYFYLFLGPLVAALAYCIIIVPLNLYSGGFTGISQAIFFLLKQTGFPIFKSATNYTGIILLLINIPLYFLVHKIVSKQFRYKSIFSTLALTIFMTIIPSPQKPMIDDTLTCVILGGILTGFGYGLVLKAGGCSGGVDFVGLFFSARYPSFSVGITTILINLIVYTFSTINGTISITIYSILFAIICSFVTDKLHHQNIMTSVTIITKKIDVKDYILKKLRRGCTVWNGNSGYYDLPIYIILSVISKEESKRLRQDILQFDSDAFIIFQDSASVMGKFEKRFDDAFFP